MMPRGVPTNTKLLCDNGVGLTSTQQLCYLELASGKAISLAEIVRPGLPLACRPGCLSVELDSQLTHLVERAAKLINQVPTILAQRRERRE